jgi:molybdenum cofactor cytidylyltransferase
VSGRAGLAGIVLAAGAGSRFGGAKQAALERGVPLVRRAAQAALACCPAGVVVVTGAHAAAVRASLAGLGVGFAHNAGWAGGMAGSLRTGLDALPPGTAACLVALADQPGVDAAELARLAAAWAAVPARAAAARYDGRLGAPAIFPAATWPALRALQGDAGARHVLIALDVRGDVTAVDMPAAARDVDTPADLPR